MEASTHYQAIRFVLYSFFAYTVASPLCHDTVPFSTKLAESPLVVTGELVDVAALSIVNNHTTPFNMTLITRCLIQGQLPSNEQIIIEHTPPENPRCYRTLIPGDLYAFFLNGTATPNFYRQMPFHELSFNDDTTIEIFKRTCGLQPQPYRPITGDHKEPTKNLCPIVSVGCGHTIDLLR